MRKRHRESVCNPFSSVRTVTVGFGFAPNLLTPPKCSTGARGLMRDSVVWSDPATHSAAQPPDRYHLWVVRRGSGWLGNSASADNTIVRNHRRWGLSPRPENVCRPAP